MTFQKGNTLSKGKGRPAGSISLVDILRQKLGKVAPGTDYSVAEKIVDEYLKDVLEKPEMKKDIFDRIDGKPMQKTETDLTSGGEKITGFVIEFTNDAQKGSIPAEASVPVQ